MKSFAPVLLLALFITGTTALARDSVTTLAPTRANVAYGEHPSQVFDLWLAETDGPAPLVIYIHGGGFRSGSKDRVSTRLIEAYLDAGIHYASIEYRLLSDAKLPAAHRDVQRALQTIRSRAREWRIDTNRIGGSGGSAGAQLAAYLAWKDDAAAPGSDDPVARESTRLAAVALRGCQSTMDLDWWVENIPGYEIAHAQHSEYFEGGPDTVDTLIEDVSVINHVSPGDPPAYLVYRMKPSDPVPAENARGWIIHHVNFGIALQKALRDAGVEVTLSYPGSNPRFENEVQFFRHYLLDSPET